MYTINIFSLCESHDVPGEDVIIKIYIVIPPPNHDHHNQLQIFTTTHMVCQRGHGIKSLVATTHIVRVMVCPEKM